MTQKNNEYKSIMDHVEIPEDVWNQTLERMQSAGQPHGILLWKKAAVLCVLLVICGISVFTAVQLKKDSGPVFISALQEDSEFSYVELEEGVLTFDKTEKISNLQVQTGSIEGKRTPISWHTLEELLSTKVGISPLPRGFTKAKEEAVQAKGKDGKAELFAELSYEKEQAFIRLQVEQGTGAIVERQNSQLNGIGLYTAMQKSGVTDRSRQYLAQYSKHGVIYTLQSSGISQKEFITILYNLTK